MRTAEFRTATPNRYEFKTADGKVCCSNDGRNPSLLCDACKAKAATRAVTAATGDSEIPDGYALGLAGFAKTQPAAAQHKPGWPKPPASMRLSGNEIPDGYAIGLAARADEEAR